MNTTNFMNITNETLREKLKALERSEILNALGQSGWVMAKAARMLGITERMIGYKVKKYDIRKQEVVWMTDEGGKTEKTGSLEASAGCCEAGPKI